MPPRKKQTVDTQAEKVARISFFVATKTGERLVAEGDTVPGDDPILATHGHLFD